MARIIGDNRPNVLFGTVDDDVINGLGDDDVLDGGAGKDFMNGGEGDDTLDGAGGNDFINGNEGDDTLDGGEGARAGKDTLNGQAGDDVLNGGLGNDVLRGGAGRDVLVGDEGSDTLIGGEGSTRYVYDELRESMPGDADRIVRFSADDRIDLRRTDLGPIRFLDDRAFTGEGGPELRLAAAENPADISVQVDADGDRQLDFEILVNAEHLDSLDFLL
jgi:Ca2+-binding RTX toxin-like protein